MARENKMWIQTAEDKSNHRKVLLQVRTPSLSLSLSLSLFLALSLSLSLLLALSLSLSLALSLPSLSLFRSLFVTVFYVPHSLDGGW